MKIHECTYGIIVTRKDNRDYNNQPVGMIVGISQNSIGEPLSVVKWQDGFQFLYHPANINQVIGKY